MWELKASTEIYFKLFKLVVYVEEQFFFSSIFWKTGTCQPFYNKFFDRVDGLSVFWVTALSK